MIPNAHVAGGTYLLFRVRLRVTVRGQSAKIQPRIRKPFAALPQDWCTGVDWSTASLAKRKTKQ
jgi:hypothetical protein